MATQFEILVPTDFRGLIEFAHQALDEVRRLEGLLSYFDPASRVSEINRDAAMRPVAVEPELFELLERSLRIAYRLKNTGCRTLNTNEYNHI